MYEQSFMWRLLFRHVFFATNHGCAFNRLQYSAAFVASIEFDFHIGGFQLFLNTFGELPCIRSISCFLAASSLTCLKVGKL